MNQLICSLVYINPPPPSYPPVNGSIKAFTPDIVYPARRGPFGVLLPFSNKPDNFIENLEKKSCQYKDKPKYNRMTTNNSAIMVNPVKQTPSPSGRLVHYHPGT